MQRILRCLQHDPNRHLLFTLKSIIPPIKLPGEKEVGRVLSDLTVGNIFAKTKSNSACNMLRDMI